jgi:hypothetical protein
MAEKISKQEAVRRALAHFGNDAKPLQMKGWIKDELGIEMSTNHVSTAKGSILKAANKGGSAKRKAGRPPSAQKAGPQATAEKTAGPKPVPGPKSAGIPLNDILYIKGLVGRFGSDQLHTLIDAFAR